MLDAFVQLIVGLFNGEAVVAQTQEGSKLPASVRFVIPRTCSDDWPHASYIRPGAWVQLRKKVPSLR